MAQILLNIMYATRSGNWELLLEPLKDVVPYTFAYDNVTLLVEISPCSFQTRVDLVEMSQTNASR